MEGGRKGGRREGGREKGKKREGRREREEKGGKKRGRKGGKKKYSERGRDQSRAVEIFTIWCPCNSLSVSPFCLHSCTARVWHLHKREDSCNHSAETTPSSTSCSSLAEAGTGELEEVILPLQLSYLVLQKTK